MVLFTADKLQQKALKILFQSGIQKFLSKYGDCEVVGSVDYGLMTWRDIDLELIMIGFLDDKSYWEIVRHLFSLKNIKLVTLADNRHGKELNRPKSMYIGLRYEDDQNKIWKMDIRLLKKEDVTSDATAKLIEEKMSQNNRLSILEIKSQVHHNPSYRKVFGSLDIYSAVIRNGVKDLNQFKIYLKDNGKLPKEYEVRE